MALDFTAQDPGLFQQRNPDFFCNLALEGQEPGIEDGFSHRPKLAVSFILLRADNVIDRLMQLATVIMDVLDGVEDLIGRVCSVITIAIVLLFQLKSFEVDDHRGNGTTSTCSVPNPLPLQPSIVERLVSWLPFCLRHCP